jgi:hypothetical protein
MSNYGSASQLATQVRREETHVSLPLSATERYRELRKLCHDSRFFLFSPHVSHLSLVRLDILRLVFRLDILIYGVRKAASAERRLSV